MNSPDYIRRMDALSGGYQRSLILFAALRGNVFEHLAIPGSAGDIALRTGWHPRGARMLLDGLVALELIEKENGIYRNAAIAEACLIEGAPYDQRQIILHRANGLEAWLGLERALTEGKGVDSEQREPEALRAFILGMDNIARNSARELFPRLELDACRRMLDVGGGPGTYAITFVQMRPEMRATILDLPLVLPIAQEQVRQAGLEDKIDFCPADMTKDPFPAGFDIILLSNVIHSFDAETNRRIVRECFGALEPGGRLIIKDFLMDEERSGPPFSLLFALYMFVSTSGGDTYTLHEAEDWMIEAGFEKGEAVAFTPQTRLLIAFKPVSGEDAQKPV